MKTKLLTLLLTFVAFGTSLITLHAADYYWVGGTGNWSSINNWATSSGGNVKHTVVPGANDDVFFDAGSFLTGTGTLTINQPATCRNMNWTGTTGTLYISGNNNAMTITGSLTLSPAVKTWTNAALFFTGSGNHTITTHGAQLTFSLSGLNFSGTGTWTLQDELNSDLVINLSQGTLNTNNKAVICRALGSPPNTVARKLILGSSAITIHSSWSYRGDNALLEAGTSQIIATGSFGSSSSFFTNPTHQYHSIKLTNENNAYNAGFSANCFIDRLEAFGNINFNGPATVKDLVLHAGKTYQFSSSVHSNITISNSLSVVGIDCGKPTVLQQDELNMFDRGKINLSAGVTVTLPGVGIQNIQFTPASPGITLDGSIDLGNNTGVTFINQPTGRTFYWVGGTGNWDDPTHWSLTDNGTYPADNADACLPSSIDNVIFNERSHTGGGQMTLTVNTAAQCNDMTWSGVLGNPILNKTSTVAAHNLNIYGSLTLQAGLTIPYRTDLIYFKSSKLNNTITTNGVNMPTIEFSGMTGSWILQDQYYGNRISHRGGHLNTNNMPVNVINFASNGVAPKVLSLGSSVLRTEYLNITTAVTVNAGTSHIIMSRRTGSTGTNSIAVLETSAQFYDLTYENDPFVFSTNTTTPNPRFNTVTMKTSGTLSHQFTAKKLEMFPGNSYTFSNTARINIENQWIADAPGCTAYIHLTPLNPDQTLNLNLMPDATYIANNCSFRQVNATGKSLSLSSGIDLGNNTNITFTNTGGSTLYWVGGAGEWHQPAHWSATSGGTSSGCIPSPNDNVVFDANSGFTPASNTVTLTASAQCRDMSWIDAPAAPKLVSLQSTIPLDIYGSLLLQSGMVYDVITTNFMANTLDNTINTNGVNITHRTTSPVFYPVFYLRGSGTWTLQNSLNIYGLQHYSGHLNTNGHNVTLHATYNSFGNSGANVRKLTLGSSIFEITNGFFQYIGTNSALDAGTSTIRISMPYSNQLFNPALINSDHKLYRLEQTSSNLNPGVLINFIQAHEVILNSNTTFSGTSSIDRLILAAGKQYTINTTATVNVNEGAFISGNPCNVSQFFSSQTGVPAKLNILGGNTNFDYVSIRDIDASGSYQTLAFGSHSTNGTGNTNMTFVPYNADAPIKGFGPNKTLTETPFPHTLNTADFYPNPLTTTFKWWKDGVLLSETGGSYAATKTGVYKIEVTYAPGCSVTDQISISGINFWRGSTDATTKNKRDHAANWTENTIPALGANVIFATADNNVGVPAMSPLLINADFSIGNLTNESEQALIVAPGKALTIQGKATVNSADRILIQSDAVQGNGTLVFSDPSQNTAVPATVEMYSKAYTRQDVPAYPRVWQYFTIPVQSAAVSPMFDGSTVRRWVSDAPELSKWQQLYAGDNLTPLTGYEIAHIAPRTLRMQGNLVTDDQSRTLTYAAVKWGDQHILGNPYTAGIDAAKIQFGPNTEESVYIYNTGSRTDWITSDGENTMGNLPGQYTAIPRYQAATLLPGGIPSMQGFLVKTQNGLNGQITIPYSALITTAPTSPNPQRIGVGVGTGRDLSASASASASNNLSDNAQSAPKKLYLIMDVTGKQSGDRLWLFEQPGTTRGFDNGWDGVKMLFDDVPQLFAMETGGNFQVNTNAGLDNTFIGFQAGVEKEYTLTFALHNTEKYDEISLIDLKRNTETVLSNDTRYTFSTTAGDDLRRFRIKAVKHAPENGNTLDADVRVNGNTLIVTNNSGAAELEIYVYDTAGRMLLNRSLAGESNSISTSLQAGAYTVHLTGGEQRTVKKIIVK